MTVQLLTKRVRVAVEPHFAFVCGHVGDRMSRGGCPRCADEAKARAEALAAETTK